MAINKKQQARLINLLKKFVTASNKAFPGAHIASTDGREWSYEEYADETLAMFGIDSIRFTLTAKERREWDEKQAAERREYARQQRALRRRQRELRKVRDR